MVNKINTEQIQPANLTSEAANEIKCHAAQEPNTQGQEVKEKKDEDAIDVVPEYQMDDKPFSVFTHNEKRIIVICAGFCALFSPSKQLFSCMCCFDDSSAPLVEPRAGFFWDANIKLISSSLESDLLPITRGHISRSPCFQFSRQLINYDIHGNWPS